MNSKANRILEMTPGQPIIIGHHSEKMAGRLHQKAWDDIGKSIEEDKKSKYYKEKAETVENSNVIYGDDPNAISKLKEKLEYLEKQRELIKADENHSSWELQNIGARIRETSSLNKAKIGCFVQWKQSIEKLKIIDELINDIKELENNKINGTEDFK